MGKASNACEDTGEPQKVSGRENEKGRNKELVALWKGLMWKQESRE